MYNIHISQAKNKYEFEELIKVFLKSGEFRLISAETKECTDESDGKTGGNETTIVVPIFTKDSEDGGKKEKDLKNQIKRFLYKELQHLTGETPDWGILTGVRPVKLAGELMQREDSEEKAREILTVDYYLTEEKAQLLIDLVAYQRRRVKTSPGEAVGLYLGIPFCPTRCVYCSFPSNQGTAAGISAYLVALHKEISFVSENMRQKGWYPESVYIGGGTPTTL